MGLRFVELAPFCLAIGLSGGAVALTLVDNARAEELNTECQAALEKRLTDLGIAANGIRDRTVARRSSGGEARQFLGYSVWLKLEQCQGSLVVDLDLSCAVKQAYGRGDCDIGRLRSRQ